MDRQKIVVVQAHPDDELLWAWPVMQRLDLFDPILLLICTNAQKGGGPMEAANILGSLWGEVSHYCRWFGPQTTSCFYRKPTRHDIDQTITMVASGIREHINHACRVHGTDLVWTHNPVGEYGHGDHRLLWELVCTTPGVNRVLYSDICIRNKSHISYDRIPPNLWAVYFATERDYGHGAKEPHDFGLDTHQKLDLDWFNEGKQVYQDHRAWSWNNPVPETCNVYCIDL